MSTNAKSVPPHGTLHARDLRHLRAVHAAAAAEPVDRLRRVLEAESFTLHYQPIVRLSDGALAHHEALLRIPDEFDGTLLAPGRYLQAAERSGMIGEIDRAVLARAVRTLAESDAFADRGLAVNISALSATDPSLPLEIEERLARWDVDPARLILEVTETAAIADMSSAKAFCERVIDLGCAIAIDDFGAGFGSFQYLKHLPFDYLKIDGDFIRALPVSHTDQLVVRALAGLVSEMGRETIAEFVGDEQTVELLREYGVDYAQGYAVGAPAPQPLLAG
ncbi:MAG TPA: EAL domain-containing protein [Solirubrobacteraceae bacterium]|nr:EAL domain-containing protein [Solirubrobacteraceae bacterium]